MGGEGDGFLAPIGEAEQGADADATKACLVGSFRAF
jgi:hypothetical protein